MDDVLHTHTLRVTLTFVGGRSESTDTYVSSKPTAGQVEIVQSAVLGRLAHVGATDTIKVHVYGIEFGLWTASVKLCNGETFAVACGTAPRRLRQGETVENVWPAHRAARGATGRECLCDQPRHGGQHAPLCPSYGAR